MRALVIASLLVATGPAFAKGIKSAGEIKLGEGRLRYMAYCAPAQLLAVTIDKRGALFQLDLAKRSAKKLGDLPTAHDFAFTADCGTLALGVSSGDDDTRKHEVHVYKTRGTPAQTLVFGTFAFPVSSLAFVGDTKLAIGLNRGPLELWSLDATPKSLDQHALPGSVQSLASANDLLAVGTYEGHVLLRRIVNNKLEPIAMLHGKAANHRETGSLDVDTGTVVMPGGGRVFAVTFVDGGRRLFATLERGGVASWAISATGTAGKLESVGSKLGAVTWLAVSPDAKLIIVGDDKRVGAWQSKGNKPVADFSDVDKVGEYAAITGAAFVGPREVLVGAMLTAAVRLYRVP